MEPESSWLFSSLLTFIREEQQHPKKESSINTKFYLPLFPKISFDFCFIQNLVTVRRCLIPLNNWFQYTFFYCTKKPIWILVNFYFCNRTVLDLICFTFATHIWEILMHRNQCTNWTTMHKQRNKKRYRNSRINNSNSSSYVKTHRAMTENTPSHTKTNATTDIVASMLSNTVLTVICLPAACFLLLAKDGIDSLFLSHFLCDSWHIVHVLHPTTLLDFLRIRTLVMSRQHAIPFASVRVCVCVRCVLFTFVHCGWLVRCSSPSSLYHSAIHWIWRLFWYVSFFTSCQMCMTFTYFASLKHAPTFEVRFFIFSLNFEWNLPNLCKSLEYTN